MGVHGVPMEALTSLQSLFSTASLNPTTASDVGPVLWALLLAMLVATVVIHWRQALFSLSPLPTGVPVLPGSLPLLGHALPVLKNLHRLHDWLYEVTQQMGEGRSYAFSLPLLPSSVMVTDPVCLEYVLKRKADNFIKGPRFYMVGAGLGAGSWINSWKLAGSCNRAAVSSLVP